MRKRKKNNKKKYILFCLIGIIIFSLGVTYAYFNKPTNIKYGFIDIQCSEDSISTAKNIADSITSTKPGIKVEVTHNENNDELFYKMLNSEVDIILPSRPMNDDERALAEEYNIAFKELPFSSLGNNEYTYMYINDMNYNHKPENKVFAKNYFDNWSNLLDANYLVPLTPEHYLEVSNWLHLIDEF